MYFEKHSDLIKQAVEAIGQRTYYTPYPELPKFYDADGDAKGKSYIGSILNTNFHELIQKQDVCKWVGEEVSPYTQTGIGVLYPQPIISDIVERSKLSITSWNAISYSERAGILVECLDRVKSRFFDIAYATMHTTGQSFMMSFQASGPHSNDRALEAIAMGYRELSLYPRKASWIKPMGKFDLTIEKSWKPIPRGIGLVIGCSTFPVWNTLPGVFANLIVGNPTIVKPHPKAILPIAIYIAEMQKVFAEAGVDSNIIQLLPDTINDPVTKQIAEHQDVKLVDYTGGSAFGSYVEGLNKIVFTEKAGVNCVIIDSVHDMASVASNLAFSMCLYSGQMCTAPQTVFIPSIGVKCGDDTLSYEAVVDKLKQSIVDLVNNPKAGAATIGAIQNDTTMKRVADIQKNNSDAVILESGVIVNPEFPDARITTPTILQADKSAKFLFGEECFGPVVFVVKTDDTNDSVQLAKLISREKGALTCSAYSTDQNVMNMIEQHMNSVFVPVSFNFTGAAFINSHAAFSDLHVTGGNAAGNASLTNTEFIAKRFVWVGNRYMG
jgi:phenylacetic acid degradation protein paaN